MCVERTEPTAVLATENHRVSPIGKPGHVLS